IRTDLYERTILPLGNLPLHAAVNLVCVRVRSQCRFVSSAGGFCSLRTTGHLKASRLGAGGPACAKNVSVSAPSAKLLNHCQRRLLVRRRQGVIKRDDRLIVSAKVTTFINDQRSILSVYVNLISTDCC